MKPMLFGTIAVLIVACLAVPARAQSPQPGGYGIFANAGFGWANNLRLADWLNAHRDLSTPALGANQVEDEEKNNIIYGGLDIEPRYMSGNLVYALALGFYNTTKGERNVTGALGSYHSEAELKAFALRASMFYRVGLASGNCVLLGGGFGYYRATLDLAYGYNNNLQSYSGSGWTIGWHTQIEYDITFGSAVVNLGVMSRFAEIWKLEINDSAGNEVYDSGASFSGIYFYAGAGYML